VWEVVSIGCNKTTHDGLCTCRLSSCVVAQREESGTSSLVVSVFHPGVLATKVGYFGVKSTKVYQVQMGTKPAKSRSLGPRCAKVRRGPHPAPTGASAKRSSIHAASKVAKVGAAGGPKLLKWGRLRARQGQIC